MSKAFTREDDDGPEEVRLNHRPMLPPGATNYLTAAGAGHLRAELKDLREVERPRLATLSSAPDGDRKIQLIDHRVGEIETILATAEVVPPLEDPVLEVCFGAAVRIRDIQTGEENRYQIVGLDEVDAEQNRISWLAPIARVLLRSKVGQRVHFEFPAGAKELEIMEITAA